jgi:prevent-host-death family protein
MKTIAQRELRNRISHVLRQVQAGERMRITVAGRLVAELVPIAEERRTFVPRENLVALLQRLPIDRKPARDLGTLDATIDEL